MSASASPKAKLRLGRIVMTHNAMNCLSEEDIFRAIQRHQAGDWGDVPEKDRSANDHALVSSTRILSAYRTPHGITFWLITEADRSTTTVLLPEDY
jgi:hypothetical protein